MSERRRRDLAVDLAGAAVTYAKIAWWGLGAPRFSESEPLVVPQAFHERSGKKAQRGDKK